MNKNISSTNFVIFFILLITVFTSINTRYGKDAYQYYYQADAGGYYSYLPAILIYQDLSFKFEPTIRAKYPSINPYVNKHKGHNINKYYIGTAICQTPAFLLAHLLTSLSKQPTDGFSKYYALSINWSALLFLLLGLIFTSKILTLLRFNNKVVNLVLICIVFGTNLFYYTYCEPGMSHVYSFAIISGFYYYLLRYFQQQKLKTLLICATFLAIIILIRPLNIITLAFIPFFISASGSKLKFLKKTFITNIAAPVCLFLILISVQPIIYYLQTSEFWVFSYKGEGFNWTHPEIFKSLFSFKKGLFIYTPIIFISLGGLLWLYRESKRNFSFISLGLLFFLYITSSWHQWYYGGSFGLRPYIDIYLIFSVLLAYILKMASEKTSTKLVFFTLLALLVLLSQIQTYQYRYHIIHWSDMNWNKYWEVFLKSP